MEAAAELSGDGANSSCYATESRSRAGVPQRLLVLSLWAIASRSRSRFDGPRRTTGPANEASKTVDQFISSLAARPRDSPNRHQRSKGVHEQTAIVLGARRALDVGLSAKGERADATAKLCA